VACESEAVEEESGVGEREGATVEETVRREWDGEGLVMVIETVEAELIDACDDGTEAAHHATRLTVRRLRRKNARNKISKDK
jgi:hypothetical protein